ncbi:MFS transporter [Ceratobasidium theobromae]|uniref:MFS transporter n=1 Tax=Ceratobasidium theobromae TaxID=1582974 RepID=A0A5N5QCB1_9AGAM|nr:MFS transporter [Ceratobasidium theobromae]
MSSPASSLGNKKSSPLEQNKSLGYEDVESPGVVSREGHVFDNPDLGKYFIPIQEYEGRHRFNPKATWTEAEERSLVRKVDKRILLWCCAMFFALQLDRGNISAALSDNLLKDLRLNTNDFNNGQLIFSLSFLCAELPSQLVSKRIGPDVWLPIQLVAWSLVAMSQCRLDGRASFFITRSLLGILEGGFVPGGVPDMELPVRLSFVWVSFTLTNISGALLGYGILHMRGLHGWEGWRYLFLIEGAMTALIGIFSFFWLPASPTQTKGVLRGKNGWFTEREEVIMVNRILRDDPSKGGMHNRQALHLSDFWASLKDYDNWGIYLLGLTILTPTGPPNSYLTLTLRKLGFDTFETNLLTIPASVLFIINVLLLSQLSRITNERSMVACLGTIWELPFLLTLSFLPNHSSPWVRFTILTLLIGHPSGYPIVIGWNSQNSNTVRTRTVSAALFNMFVQAGGIIATHIYNEDDKPFYHKGNKVLTGIAAWNAVLYCLIKLYYIRRNKWKAARWNAMSTEEKARYLETTTDKGNKRLDFIFVH